ncbi:Adenine specific DNA methylase Mod [Enterobacter cloacae]|uniref:site-specific DNA-methyltransferase n=1 Tax=Enterobacter cloacae TaxID=550 RepID=UPI00079454E0|nr:site-specific DNA-methyltransferase [Enterobacter cloacae]CZV38681.1 Adenine specific DNA methylase Mod [Enterobacter cloacae]HAS0908129.1 site-specific DNA-methyltransferase [Enterobacter cloacae]HDC4832222.1 site-specific DNA-methyltransferase [Enterobacter cloacae]
MDKLKMHSPNLVEQNIDKLAALFPNCVTESKDENGKLKQAIDFDLLKQELSRHIVDGPQERYQLNWPGKREALLTANAPIAKTLRPCREESVNFDTTRNLFIEGDNLDALKLLQETYLGKIKVIYIDPPYNTGSDFIYGDDFSEDSSDFLMRSNQIDKEGNRLIANYETNGRFHSDWMSMIYSRIRLARNLLTEDGVILVSIGPEEVKNLMALLGDVFGESNRVSVITWEKGRKNDSTFFSESAEYILIFAKNKECLASKGKWRERKEGLDIIFEAYENLKIKFNSNHQLIETEMRKFYSQLDDNEPAKKLAHFYRSDDRGLYFGADISSASTSIPDYEIIHPITKKPVKKPSRGWGATEQVMLERIAKDEVLFGPDESTIPLKKSYLAEVDSIVKTPVLYKDGRAASGILKGLFGDVVFNNPKDHVILSDIISYCLQGNKDAIILDFFAGSSSTAHAVMDLNYADGGNRKFFMVQLPEVLNVELATNPVAKQTIRKATNFLMSINKSLTIAEISKERIRRAGEKILSNSSNAKWSTDIGFRVLKIDTSSMSDIYYTPDALAQDDLFDHVENVKSDRTEEDLLFQVMLDWGVDLTLPIRREIIADKAVFFVDAQSDNSYGALVACFDKTGSIDEDFIKQLAAFSPLRLVFRDAGFVSDAAKTNAEQLLKQLSATTDVKTI